jgi:thiamine biosynthesis lipoprotein
MHRRDFLHPRHAARAAGELRGLLADVAEQPAAEVALVRMARRAMATTFAVLVPFGTPDATVLGRDALDLVDELEDQLTVYRPSSEVCRLNRLAPHRRVPVEPGLFDLLDLAAKITEETSGAFDIAAGALVKAWGFFRGPRRVPGDEELRRVMERVGTRHVELDPGARSVRYRREGLEINLGAIGKGYALDRVCSLLRERWGLRAGLLHGGYSSVYATGCPPGDGRGWLVGVRHPWDPGRRLALVRLRDRALGTSAATFQHFEHQGRKLGHVLDPRTGWPAEGMAAASVLAPTAALADALSTAFFVGGVEVARQYCDNHPEVGALLLPAGEGAAPVVLGLRPDEYALEVEPDRAR